MLLPRRVALPGAPGVASSHFLQTNVVSSRAALPSVVVKHGRFSQAGSVCRCRVCPHSSSATHSAVRPDGTRPLSLSAQILKAIQT